MTHSSLENTLFFLESYDVSPFYSSFLFGLSLFGLGFGLLGFFCLFFGLCVFVFFSTGFLWFLEHSQCSFSSQ